MHPLAKRKDPNRAPLRHLEQELQIAIFNKLEAEMRFDKMMKRPARFFAYHCANGGYRTKAEAGLFCAMGVKSGVGDIPILLPEGKTIFIELKFYTKWKKESDRVPTEDEALSESQKEFAITCRQLGIPFYMVAAWCHKDGIDQVLNILRKHGVEI